MGFSKRGVLQNRAVGAHARNCDLGSGGRGLRTASATGERVGRGGSQALFPPTSYLAHTPPTTTPSWLVEDRVLFYLVVIPSLQVCSTTKHPCWRARRKSLK